MICQLKMFNNFMEFLKNKKEYFWIAFGIFLVAVFALVFWGVRRISSPQEPGFTFHFSGSGEEKSFVLEEASSAKKSSDSHWWVNSGGMMKVEKDYFSTNLGKLKKDNFWRKLYKKNNSRDTDDGYYLQNIFRLVTRSEWQNMTQEVYFNISEINLSDSDFRNESNGVLLFNRYGDGDNLYYTGLRVDGHAVIKKKIDGKYHTMVEKSVFKKGEKYDRDDNPNLLPQNSWIGLKSELRNSGKKTVEIKLYIDAEGKGDWQLVLEAKDNGEKYGGSPFLEKGRAGIRTDFMDVKFRDYRIEENIK
jgi:hypothetical protein